MKESEIEKPIADEKDKPRDPPTLFMIDNA